MRAQQRARDPNTSPGEGRKRRWEEMGHNDGLENPEQGAWKREPGEMEPLVVPVWRENSS